MALAWLLSVLTLVPSASGADDSLCIACGRRLGFGMTIYSFKRRGQDKKVWACAECAKLDTQCYICGVPVKDKLTQLSDGRLLCTEDAAQAVLEQHVAENLFEDVKRDCESILSQLGSLPHHNISLVLEAKARLDKQGGNIISTHDDSLLMGLTRTRREEGQFKHSIFLLHGLTRERMIVVAAHEYAHAWIHENVRRKMNQDCVEGFCDWLAWKVITQKSAPYETKVLLDSRYSRGQLQAFIAAEKEHGFYRVMLWVKGGNDPEIEIENLARINTLRDDAPREAPSVSVIPTMAPAPRPAPTHLVLKGLSGTPSRRFALINDGTFMANESGKVRLGTSNVVIRCVEIRADAVLIEVAGEKKLLRLEAAR